MKLYLSCASVFLTTTLALSSCIVESTPKPTAPTTFDETVQSAINTVSQYWTIQFAGTDAFKNPAIYSYSTAGDPYCDGDPSELDNAMFCPSGSFVAFDVNFLRDGYQKYGATFVYFIFSHEFGHAAQNAVGQPSTSTKERELQADCLSGAYFAYSQKQSWIVLKPDDMVELQDTVVSLGDDSRGAHPEGDSGHGSGEERYSSLSKGYTGTVSACGLNGF